MVWLTCTMVHPHDLIYQTDDSSYTSGLCSHLIGAKQATQEPSNTFTQTVNKRIAHAVYTE